MKTFLVLFFSLLALPAFADYNVTDARYNFLTKSIEVDLAFNGCSKHEFKLEIQPCLENLTPQCQVKVIDLTKDEGCDMGGHETYSFSLQSLGLDTPYYAGASLHFENTNISIVLPRAEPNDSSK